MQVKKFEAPTMAEALKLVKTELGPEAIILSTKNYRKGFGLLSKASVEVTAAISEKTLSKKQITEKLVAPQTKSKIEKLSATQQNKIYNEFSDYIDRRKVERTTSSENTTARTRTAVSSSAQTRYIDISDDEDLPSNSAGNGYARNGRPVESANRVTQQAPTREAGHTIVRSAVHADSESLRMATSQVAMSSQVSQKSSEEIDALQDELQKLKQMLEEVKSEQTALVDARSSESSGQELQVEYQNLIRNGIDKKYASSLIKHVSFELDREQAQLPEKIVEALAVEMMANIKVAELLDYKPSSERRVYALVGPTGVGKTTTIAKLASQAILQKNLRVGLINIDSYKVAAVDQLATYAKILNVPFRQASSPIELERALAEFKPLDLVLIDTTGRSQRDSESLVQLKNLISESTSIRPIMIMSATTRDQELYDIATRFKMFNPTGLIVSKLDESTTFGSVYNVAIKTGLPLTYFAVGQRVPEDLEVASRERVVDLILDL